MTGSGFGVRDWSWIERQLAGVTDVVMRDVSNAYATINLCGHKAREVLQQVTGDDVSNEAFAFLAAQRIEVGMAEVLACRVGYVGELGWELYVAQEFAAHVYDTLWQAGAALGIANAGYRAIESCRLEKGYLYWSADIGPDINPYEAGLGFCVALDKGDFVGRAALESVRDDNSRRRMAAFSLDGFVPLHGGEPIIQNADILGYVTSAGYGHSVGKTIALGLLPAHAAAGAPFEVEAFGRIYHAQRNARCLYDPGMERLKS